MADQQYMSGRQKYQRPQALLFSENPGQLVNGSYVPEGYEINSGIIGIDTPNSFLILSDHSRGPITVKPTRIEQRQRTVNGHMRSYHVADKLTISTSWNLLPSRSFALDPLFDENGTTNVLDYTVDGGAGGNDLLNWYENHTGSFYVFLAYDKYPEFNTNPYQHLAQYNQVKEMFISNFDYTIEKRGGNTYDMWNVSITLEEA